MVRRDGVPLVPDPPGNVSTGFVDWGMGLLPGNTYSYEIGHMGPSGWEYAPPLSVTLPPACKPAAVAWCARAARAERRSDSARARLHEARPPPDRQG
ncbi:MAG TPA: hypothetical protein VJT73_06760 [Polyangiaceae bacterium]|nr:hypothetical protein [Polyangiaceae bacterium]